MVLITNQHQTIIEIENCPPGGFVDVNDIRNLANRCDEDQRLMQELNGRFAGFLQRLDILERENQTLEEQYSSATKRRGVTAAQVRSSFEPELAALRRSIDEITEEKTKVELEAKSIEYELVSIRRYIEFRKSFFDSDRHRLKDLSGQLTMSVADIESLQLNLADKTERLERIKFEHAGLEKTVNELKVDYIEATRTRIRIQNQFQSLEEAFAFMKAVHELEGRESNTVETSGFSAVTFYKQELSTAIQKIKEDFRELRKRQRKEMEVYYQGKIAVVKDLVNKTKLANERPGNVRVADASVNDLLARINEARRVQMELRQRNAALSGQLQKLQPELSFVECQYHQIQDKYKQEFAHECCEVQQLERGNSEVVERIDRLRFEIRAYKNLLDMHVSSPPTEQRVARSITPPSPRFSPPPPPQLSRPGTEKYCTIGSVRVEKIDSHGDFITIGLTESDGARQSMNNWRIVQQGSGVNKIYNFPGGLFVAPRGALRVWSRQGAQRQRLGPSDLVADDVDEWIGTENGSFVRGRLETSLYDAGGVEQASVTLTSSQ